MSLVAKLVLSLTGPITVRQFERKCRKPREAQEALLRHIVEKNRDTAFGKKHGFESIDSLRAFQEHVPICTYEDLQPYIEAELHGKEGQLTAEKPVLFAMTSGTTGEAKYIPVTPESRKAKADLMRLWITAFYRDHPEIFTGRVLSVVSPEEETRSPDGTPVGAESGHAYRNIPAPLQSLYALPYEVFEIEDYEARYYTILRIAAAQPISLITAVNPSTLVVLCERLARRTRGIIRDVREGGLSRRVKVSSAIREKIAGSLQADPQRAEELERAAAEHGNKLLPKAIWPGLAAIACWQGGSVGAYLERLRACFPEGIPIRDLGYLASEHRGSVPLRDDEDTGVLAVATNVYEFFPADLERKPRPRELLAVDELEPGERYFVYVTTLGGLYRYDMNDIVEVVAYHEKTPMIRFVQKGKGVVSLTGEKLSEAQVMAAFEEAFRPVKGKYEFIAAVGEMNGATPQYAFLVEFDRAPAAARLEKVVHALDDALCAQNGEYASKRKSARLEPPVLRIVRRGEFDRYRKRQIEGGRTDAQFKILRITADEDFARAFEVAREVKLSRERRARRRKQS